MITSPPHFIGIGAQRSGTSWMFECFLEHPEIFMPQKEMQFFNKRPLSELDSYLAKFTEQAKVCGEITPDYLSSRTAIDGISKACPNAKLIIILRNPVERTRSSYSLYKERDVTDITSLDDVFTSESVIFTKSLYGEQVEYLFSRFNPDNIKVVFFDRIKTEPIKLIQEVFAFIGVDPSFTPQSATRNFNASSVGFGSKKVARTLTLIQNYLHKRAWGRSILNIKKTAWFKAYKHRLVTKNQLSANDNAKYYEYFADDIAKLEKQIGSKVPDSWKYGNL